MRIGKVLYPTDEISAKRPRARQIPYEALNAGPARFEAGPPGHWKRELDRSLWATGLSKQTETPTIVRNRPVPRAASHHYDGQRTFHLTSGPVTFYFY